MKEWVAAERKKRLVEFAAQNKNPRRTEKQPSQRVSNLIVTMFISDDLCTPKSRILPCKTVHL